MPEATSLKFLFIINPGSGGNSGKPWERLIEAEFTDERSETEIFLLPEKIEPEEILKKIKNARPQCVVAVGGDGTVTLLANLLAGTDIPLGILPGGSANGMAKELGIPVTPEGAFEVIRKNNIKALDLIKINDRHYCLHMSDLGLNARLIKYFDEGKLRGKMGYAKVILKTLLHREKLYVNIRTNETEVKRIAFMVVLANARMYGTGAVINPEGLPHDGLFEVIIVRKLSLSALARMLIRPRMFDPKHIEIFSCTAAEIKTTRRIHFQVDGEYLGKVKAVNAVIKPKAVKLILPA